MRGTIDAGDYKQYIFPLLFFKRICDVYNEEFENALTESDGDVEYATFAENQHFLVLSATVSGLARMLHQPRESWRRDRADGVLVSANVAIATSE